MFYVCITLSSCIVWVLHVCIKSSLLMFKSICLSMFLLLHCCDIRSCLTNCLHIVLNSYFPACFAYVSLTFVLFNVLYVLDLFFMARHLYAHPFIKLKIHTVYCMFSVLLHIASHFPLISRFFSSAMLSYFCHQLYINQYIPLMSLVSNFLCNLPVKSFHIDFDKEVCLSCTVTCF